MADCTEIHVNLWPTGTWSESDQQEIAALLGHSGRQVRCEVTHDMRGISPEAIIEFVAHTVATGFFLEIGTGSLKWLRERLSLLLFRPRTDAPDVPKAGQRLSVRYVDDRGPTIEFDYSCECDSPAGLDPFWRGLAALNKAVSSTLTRPIQDLPVHPDQVKVGADLTADNGCWRVQIVWLAGGECIRTDRLEVALQKPGCLEFDPSPATRDLTLDRPSPAPDTPPPDGEVR